MAKPSASDNWIEAFQISFSVVTVLWVVMLINAWFGYQLNYYGIYPREVVSLSGVLLWPLLHLNFYHLTLNTTPLLVLGYFVALRGLIVYLKATMLILVFGGVGVWVFGRPAVHIGSSGLVFGFFGFLVAVGIYEKSISSLAIASFTLFYYGGMLYGVIPVDSFISWEAHFFGLLAGVWAARLLAFQREHG